jgi:hypothetical protein
MCPRSSGHHDDVDSIVLQADAELVDASGGIEPAVEVSPKADVVSDLARCQPFASRPDS